MRRTNTFRLRPTKKQEERLFHLAENCARMWNEINYKRRQSFFNGEIDWDTDEFYDKYKKLIGSATAQTIIRKNNESWKSFFSLLKKWKKGKMDKPKPPRYWKNRIEGKRNLIILIRNDSYTLDENTLKLPLKLKIRWTGKNKWKGKQGRLEIQYDSTSKKWYAFQPVEIEPPHQPIGNKKAYIDIGVKVPIMSYIDGETFGYKGNSLLSDWWYWTNKIAEYQSKVKKENDRYKSKRLSKLYRKRKKRFRQGINTIVSRFIRDCYDRGVSEIYMGDLTGIRNNSNKGKKVNSMIHNYWSHEYLTRRIKEKAEEYGITVKTINEGYTSSVCPACGSTHIRKIGRLFKCLDCGLEAHRDAVGSVNIGLAQGEKIPVEVINGVVAHPLLCDSTA